jgi:trk system potassium uptake protein TrkH
VLREAYGRARGAIVVGFAAWRPALRAGADTPPGRPPRWSLQSRIVLVSSGGLILLGAACFYVFETPSTLQQRYRQPPGGELRVPNIPNAMNSLPPGERALSALFLSVTARTAGFNTVRMDTEALSPTTHFLLCILMFIGGSPASTAGGVKTVTLSILVLTVLATLRRREQIEAFGRSLHWPLIRTATALVTLYALLISAATTVLCFTEVFDVRDVLFEVCSATGTVGLSTGVTPHLTDVGRAVIILCMFAGRLGPLTLLVALAGHMTPARYEYPPERLIIG